MTISQRILLGTSMVLLLALLAWNGVLARRNLHQIRSNEQRQQSSATLDDQVRRLRTDALEIESAYRGYLLSDDDSYLAPFRAARGRVPEDIAALKVGLAKGSDDARADRLNALFNAQLTQADQIIALRQKGYKRRALAQFSNGNDQRWMNEIGADLASISATESLQAAESDTQASVLKAMNSSVLSSTICLLATGMILMVMYLLYKTMGRQISIRQRTITTIDSRWSGLREVISRETLVLLSEISAGARQLFDKYGDFLPLSGQERAKSLQQTAERAEHSVNEALRLEETRSDAA